MDSIEDAGSFHLNSTETTNNDPETSSEIALDDNKHPVSNIISEKNIFIQCSLNKR